MNISQGRNDWCVIFGSVLGLHSAQYRYVELGWWSCIMSALDQYFYLDLYFRPYFNQCTFL